MPYATLISHQELIQNLDRPSWAVVDCRFDLSDPARGEHEYMESHIPGAVYAHLERDLSASPTGTSGRHPLPSPETLSSQFAQWGIGPGVQVVAYDDSGGPLASRLWWSLRYMGHKAVAVLNGGYPSWTRANLPTCSGEESRSSRTFEPKIRSSMRADIAQVLMHKHSTSSLLLDARSPERYRGEEEPLDPVAGHIPDAVNHFWGNNLDDMEHFLPRETLRANFNKLLGEISPQSIISYCGSGVTSCHNLLALAYAGLDGARLYPGSWSEWCADPTRPVATGDEPLPNLTPGLK